MALYPIKGIRIGGDVHPIDYDALHGKKCVEFTPQTLEEEQKAQVRENIDAVSKRDLNTRLGGLKIIHNEDGSISITDGEPEE